MWDSWDISRVVNTQFHAILLALGMESSGRAMPPNFFQQSFRITPNGYILVLETVHNPWIEGLAGGLLRILQQGSAPAHKAQVTQDRLADNIHPHNFPDLNSLD